MCADHDSYCLYVLCFTSWRDDACQGSPVLSHREEIRSCPRERMPWPRAHARSRLLHEHSRSRPWFPALVAPGPRARPPGAAPFSGAHRLTQTCQSSACSPRLPLFRMKTVINSLVHASPSSWLARLEAIPHINFFLDGSHFHVCVSYHIWIK